MHIILFRYYNWNEKINNITLKVKMTLILIPRKEMTLILELF
jgi:hypothetical protein